MNFTVHWTEAAVQMLAAIWLAAADRNAITIANDEIDETLREDADTVGRLSFDTVREYERPPVGVQFEVVETDRIVYVLSCWLIA
jgi:hypothetical protein